mmetsp:Transcript_10695/g.17855  ORF Transcript_10695/g.17855 Transcript_10695/m.17855 type:complete len:174 (-) Transcript_10695:77-598(-)
MARLKGKPKRESRVRQRSVSLAPVSGRQWGPAKSRTPVSTRRPSAMKSPRLSSSSVRTPRKKRRHRPGVKALKEIRHLQSTTDLLIPRRSFSRLVREIATQITNVAEYRWQALALMALQDATEAYLTGIFEDALLCCIHARRVTLFRQDVQLARRLRGEAPIPYSTYAAVSKY